MNAAEVKMHLDWCKQDWGFNEGAQEAINYINSAVGAGYATQVGAVIGIVNNLPGGVGYHVAGNTLKRPPIVDAARGLVLVAPDLAVDLVLTCQAHNQPVRDGLAAQKPLVISWLQGKL
ncbi:hypothetical protein [Rhizobium leguminosarum]